MKGLHENQRKILEYLLDHHQGATLEELSSHLEITKTAAKEHINKLDGMGLINYQDTKGLVGRPRRRYLLSQEGHEAFPRQYSWLSNVLLELLAQEMGPEALTQMMENLADKVASSMASKFENTKSSAELLTKVTVAMNELGYRTSLKQSDLRKGAILEATNCVYHSVAKAHPELCRFDVQFLKNTTGGLDVELQSCIARGGSVCRFCVRKK